MIKTANLTANTETSISGLGGTHCRINNNTAGTLYASANSGIVPGGDDVTAIPAGRGDYVVGTQGTVYLLSASGGSVQVEGTDVLNRPFDETAVASVAAVGNPVIMDGLQGGVPFNSVEVSGKNLLLGIVNLYPTTNGNLAANSNAISVYAKCNPNTTYTIQRNGGSRLQCAATQALPSNGTTFSNLIVAADQTANTITYTTPDNCNYIAVYLTGSSEEVTDIQIEEGDTATAYEPPITGRELTLAVGGENILTYPYPDSTKTTSGITFTDNGDGTITANGTAINDAYFGCLMNGTITGGKFILRGCPKGGQNQTYNMLFNVKKPDGTSRYVGDLGNGCEVELSDGETIFEITIKICAGTTVTNLKFNPVALRNGSLINITPDSNPYTVPNDIRQQDGLNVVTASAGELSVTGVRKNAAIKKIWDKLDELTTAVIVSTADLSE